MFKSKNQNSEICDVIKMTYTQCHFERYELLAPIRIKKAGGASNDLLRAGGHGEPTSFSKELSQMVLGRWTSSGLNGGPGSWQVADPGSGILKRWGLSFKMIKGRNRCSESFCKS